jgi:hypothetical protein
MESSLYRNGSYGGSFIESAKAHTMASSLVAALLLAHSAVAFRPVSVRFSQSKVTMSASMTKKETRKAIMEKEDFIRSPQKFKAEKAVVDALMLAEFKVW